MDATINTLCVLCQEYQKTCQHSFFRCGYLGKVWKDFSRRNNEGKILLRREILEVIFMPRPNYIATEIFLIRCTLQILLHSLWRECNVRRHGEQPRYEKVLIKCMDKLIRLKLLALKEKGQRYLEKGLCAWFGSRMQRSS